MHEGHPSVGQKANHAGSMPSGVVHPRLPGGAPPRLAVALCLCLAGAGCGSRSSLDTGAPSEGGGGSGGAPPGCQPGPPAGPGLRLGDAEQQVGASLAFDASGVAYVAGAFHGELDLGFTTLTAPPTPSDQPLFEPPRYLTGRFFLARLAEAGCGPFAVAFSPMEFAGRGIHVAVDQEGAAVLTASYFGPVDFGAGPVGLDSQLSNAAIVKFGPTGVPLWTKGLVGADAMHLAAPALDAEGNIFTGTVFRGDVEIDGAVVGSSQPGLADALVVKLAPDGTLLWTRVLRLSTQNPPAATLSVAAWPGGDVAISGVLVDFETLHPIDLGGGSVGAPGQKGYLTSFDADGEHRWDHLINPKITGSVVGPTGILHLLGAWDGKGFPVAHYDAGGNELHIERPEVPFGEASIAVGPAEEVVVAGSAGLPTTSDGSLFAYEIAPSGEVAWTRSFLAPGRPVAYPAFDPTGAPWWTGAFSGSIDLGFGSMQADGVRLDAFVAPLSH